MTTKYAAYRNAVNEGGEGYNPYEEEMLAEARAKAEARIQEIIDNMDTYRAAWNAAVAKYVKGGVVDTRDLKAIEAEAGITKAEMQTVKARMAA